MSVTPTGILSTPPDLLRDLIAGTSAFQTWTGTDDATAAKLRTHLYVASYEGLVRPFCMVYFSRPVFGRGGYTRGELTLTFQSNVPAQYRRGGAEEHDVDSPLIDHDNHVGDVIRQACQNAEGDGMLLLDHEEMFYRTEPPLRTRPEEVDRGEDDFIDSHYVARWGIRL